MLTLAVLVIYSY